MTINHCPRHPGVETNLRCGKCEKFICPKCCIQTPVGARCPDCAKLNRLPVFQVTAVDHLKAIGVGLGLAIAFGILWGIADSYLYFFSNFTIVVTAYIIAEMGSRSVKRKRGRGLSIIFGTSVLLSFFVSIGAGLETGILGILALAAGLFIATSQFK